LAGTPVASSTAPVPIAVGGRNDSTTNASCTKSSTAPTVTATAGGVGAATASVKAAGINVLLPSGSTTRNSATPCRSILPRTRNTLP
jgi:hypothetical protein